jgi:hypothetical protein
MDRKVLESAAATYSYLQGELIPLGLCMAAIGVNSGVLPQGHPHHAWALGISSALLVLGFVAAEFVRRFFRENYGVVRPRSAHVRRRLFGAAVIVLVVVFGNVDNFARYRLPSSPICLYAGMLALAVLLYYRLLVGLRRHHVLIWITVAAAALLPIWGGLGAHRDAYADLPLGLALAVSGLLDQRLLVRSMRAAVQAQLEGSDV